MIYIEAKHMSLKANEILSEGEKCLRARAALRDSEAGERSAKRAAAIVSAWEGVEVDELHIWRVLAAVKMARSMQGRHHEDDYVDAAAYIALLGETAGAP